MQASVPANQQCTKNRGLLKLQHSKQRLATEYRLRHTLEQRQARSVISFNTAEFVLHRWFNDGIAE